MKKIVYPFLLLLALSGQAAAQQAGIFPRGEIATVDNHTGTVWLKELSEPDSVFTYSIATATFAPGAKLDWHMHPAGQILLITEGTGYYQERGKPRQTVQKGEVIKCLPGVEHWHGASPTSTFTYLATTPTQKGKTVWFKRVTDAEYRNGK
jgi:quercetin dioxygenase-like cupin family protein